MGYGFGSINGLNIGITMANKLGFFIGLFIFLFIGIYLLESVAFSKLFEKAGQKKHMAFVPFYRHYIKYNIVWESKGWLGIAASVLSFICFFSMSYFMFCACFTNNFPVLDSFNALDRTVVNRQLLNTSYAFCSLGIAEAGIFMVNLFMYYKMTRSFVSKRVNFPSLSMFFGLVFLPVLFLLILGFSRDYSYRGISIGNVGDNFFNDLIIRRKKYITSKPAYATYRQLIVRLSSDYCSKDFCQSLLKNLDTQTTRNAEDDVCRYICFASYISCGMLLLAWYFGGSFFAINYINFGCIGFVLAFINYNHCQRLPLVYHLIPLIMNSVLIVVLSTVSIF